MLPLQGFWNALVYIVTSQTACADLWREVTGAQELPTKGKRGRRRGDNKRDVVNGGVVGLKDLRGAKGGDTRRERFTSRRTSQRLESDDCSVASLRGR